MSSSDRTPDLFEDELPPPPKDGEGAQAEPRPLADRMRPRTLDELLGQDEALDPDGFLSDAVRHDRVPSLILWGPPGCGKTSLAHVIAQRTAAAFEPFSAVLGGIAEVRAIVKRAAERQKLGGRTILFVDEIHRFNKAQQDAFLPHVEKGTVTLIGATTENPSFALIAALLSRCRVVRLQALPKTALARLLERTLADEERGLGAYGLEVAEGFAAALAEMADGDARRALNLLEQAAEHAAARERDKLDLATLREVLERAPLRYDRTGDAHYDTISAFIKSLRGSDPDAALYYAARMIESGEDPRFVLRRLVIFASEDVGNADPRALQIAMDALGAYERLGMPEGVLPLAQAVTYCATAPKSNASYAGWLRAVEDARGAGSAEVPLHIRNAPTGLMKRLGYGKAYQYPHDKPGHFIREQYLPDELAGRRYYVPSNQGYEQRIAERLRIWWGEESEEGSE